MNANALSEQDVEDLFAAMEKAMSKALADPEFSKASSRKTLRSLDGNVAGVIAGMVFLLKRIKKLEALPFEYAGIHESQKRYFKNQFVTHGGRVWACVVDYTIQQPGTTDDWKLAVNKGRDGRDAK